MCPLWGEVEALWRATPPHKQTTKNQVTRTPLRTPHQATQPRTTPTPLTKDDPKPPSNHSAKLFIDIVISNSMWFQFYPVNNDPGTTSFIKAFEQGFGWVGANLNKFNNPSPSYLAAHNKVSHFGLMPLFMVEHPIISFNSNCPKGDASKRVPNLDISSKFYRNSFPKEDLLPHLAKLMHNEGGPLSNTPGLNAIPKLVFNWFTGIWKAKHTLFRDVSRSNPCPALIICGCYGAIFFNLWFK